MVGEFKEFRMKVLKDLRPSCDLTNVSARSRNVAQEISEGFEITHLLDSETSKKLGREFVAGGIPSGSKKVLGRNPNVVLVTGWHGDRQLRQ